MDNKNTLLAIQGLVTEFNANSANSFRAVDKTSLSIKKGEIYGLVGESGCGKTMTSLSIMGLVDSPGVISQGKIIWKGNDLLEFGPNEMRKIRGKEMAMIFQNPQAALNPLYTIGNQLGTVIRIHNKKNKEQINKETIRLLELVKLNAPDRLAKSYPHQLSGGQCQRVLIAMALSCKPELLIADEPTAALDVTIQAQILDLLLDLREEFKMALLLISHDMGVVANMCERLSVMYLGQIVEESETSTLYSDPKHPYTQALLGSVPVPEPQKGRTRFSSMQGDIINYEQMDSGCRFRPRCPKAFDKCTIKPSLKTVNNTNVKTACWLYE